MNGLPYYKAYPRDFIEGTIGMRFELKAAYRMTLDLIYMQGGRLPDDDRYISGLLGCSVRAWKKYREELLSLGKIYAENGIISNFRADKELETLAKVQEQQRENARGPRKNKDLQKPRLNHTDTDTDIKSYEPKGSLSSACDDAPPVPQPPDEVQQAFDAYNVEAEAAGWPRAALLSKSRRAKLRQRLKSAGGLPGWRDALAKARASPLCCGANDRGWTADLDFLLQEKSFTKLMEGSYDNRPRQSGQPAARSENRADPALEQIARLTGFGAAPGGNRH